MSDQAPSTSRRHALREGVVRVGQFLTSAYTDLPLGTAIIVSACVVIHFLNIFTKDLAWTSKGCLAAWAYLKAPVANFHRLFANQFLHVGIFHLVLNILAFPSFAAPIERDIGTFQFLHVIFLWSFINSFLYVLLGSILGLITLTGWGTACSAGLSGLIFSALTVEAVLERGIFTPRRIFGREIAGVAYPWIIFGIAAIITPWASFIGHLSGILGGMLYAYHLLDFLLLPSRFIAALQSARIFSALTARSNYHEAPGGVALPTNANELPSTGGAASSRGGLFSKVRSAFGGARYTPVGNPPLSPDDDNDPLLWEDDEPDLEDNVEQP
ncbi:uncharacterized protein SPPG_05513 [Spizellomyces punctatus DAOM BR117]|uniref:rhomboid protease n=1 Tax=Spizellomyces punctatus (strain DAOM BR117) TaxID=645134 RepID=A0A0L0HES0_SPIPD|nr:uncharacterized protein SPPG_05513 [Spizellomyces punctatus DAOM BR117]KNC99258.1 hypothetical protein SPPG_05513 [Spizellomyces punctatus DAOM BR117]|eukprot:XP_016607298.1 hypothetical protein SPPG_05513 [Spizellomyces punctatus DAOM BR117]